MNSRRSSKGFGENKCLAKNWRNTGLNLYLDPRAPLIPDPEAVFLISQETIRLLETALSELPAVFQLMPK